MFQADALGDTFIKDTVQEGAQDDDKVAQRTKS